MNIQIKIGRKARIPSSNTIIKTVQEATANTN